jgi:hypothetical protein
MNRKSARIVTGLVILEVVGIGAYYLAEKESLRRDAKRVELLPFPEGYRPQAFRMEYFAEGIERPPVLSASSAPLEDSEEVVGVVVGGKARAYRLSALTDMADHIVNDVVEDRPISVTYCDKRQCIRVFTAEGTGTEALPIGQAGLWNYQMVIQVGRDSYLQESGDPLDPEARPFPYQQYPSQRTTWREWRESHPETEVYAGILGRQHRPVQIRSFVSS